MTLRDYLTAQSITVRAFAARLDVSPVTVSRWLSGDRRPDWRLLPRIETVTDGQVTARDFVVQEIGS